MSDKNGNDGPPAGNYEVGFQKPPKKSRFKKGESGNSRGRPLGSPNMRTIVKKSINRKIPMKKDGKKTEVPAKEAAFLALQMDAIRGKASAQKLYFEKIEKFAPEELEATVEEMRLSPDNRTILERYLERQFSMTKETVDEGA